MFIVSTIDGTTAKRLAYVLKTFLGLEAIIKLVIFIYCTVAENGEINYYSSENQA